MKKNKIFVVTHTHWDKEWYFTKQDSDVLLNNNIKHALYVISKYKGKLKYTFDGQSSIIDDYIQYAQTKDVEKLLALAKKNNIFFGPWYTQPDFYNISSESITRNLLLGINTTNHYGLDHLHCAYVPDSFGQNAQMPQIYKQFNLDRLIYWRGISKDDLKPSTYHNWKGVDGTIISCFNLLSGYWPMGMFFPYTTLKKDNVKPEAATFLSKIKVKLDEIISASNFTNNTVLLPFGGDQAPLVDYLPEFIQELNKLDKDNEWILSDYDSFYNQLPKDQPLRTIQGNLITPATARIHRTIGSQRVDIKILMKEIEYDIYSVLEPLASYVNALGGEYNNLFINYVLKQLLTTQAHDSIGGCNSDATNHDIQNRLFQVRNAVKSTITKLIKTIAIKLNLQNDDFIIFNNKVNSCPKATHYNITLFTKFKNFKIVDENNNEVEYTINYCDQPNPEALVAFYTYKITIKNYYIPLFTFKQFRIVESKYNDFQLKPINKISTKHWDIKVNKDGTVNIYDKLNDVHYYEQFKLIAEHDAGDSYDFSTSKTKPGIISKLIKSSYDYYKSGESYKVVIHNTYSLPRNENEPNINQKWELTLLINDDVDMINININTNNVAKAVRWRLCCNYSFLKEQVYSNQAYSTLVHPVDTKHDQKIWKQQGWHEYPAPIWTNESYVYLENKNIKSGFITCGNNCFEVINKETSQLQLDLLRSVSYLGRRDLAYRPGRASGIDDVLVHTPDAELQKYLEFNISWFSTKNKNIWKLASEVNTPTIYYQLQKYTETYYNFDKFVYLDDKSLDFNQHLNIPYINSEEFTITTIKKAENSNDIIIRGFNNSDKTIKINFVNYLNKPIFVDSLNLLEQPIKNHINKDTLHKYEIKTYRISKKEK